LLRRRELPQDLIALPQAQQQGRHEPRVPTRPKEGRGFGVHAIEVLAAGSGT
jgi:hypothetical protein